MRLNLISAAIGTSLLLSSCGNNSDTQPANTPTAPQVSNHTNGNGASNIITYLVHLTPEAPDYAEKYNLFNREAFVDSIFQAVYYHRAHISFDEAGLEPATIDDIKTREIEDPKYARQKLTGVQFTEEWTFDPATKQMNKRVLRMFFGYEQLDQDSSFLGYWPGFAVHFD